MTRLKSWLVAGTVLLLGKAGKPRLDRERIVEAGPKEPRAELAIIGLFGLSSLCAIAFVVVYALDRLPHQTQLLGLALGLSLAFLAAALIATGKQLVVEEELQEQYPDEHPVEEEQVEQIVEESGSRITRKRLFGLAAGGAAGSLGLAALAPVLSFGPALDVDPLFATPWRKGRRLVDEQSTPLRAADIEPKVFYSAFPEGGNREDFGAPLIVVRLDPAEIKVRRGWAPGGILAYSKICTHAGCAINLYRTPTFAPVEPRPALVCPCHYSTFDPADGGRVLFGPAGRELPQLPLAVDKQGFLRAAGNFSGPVGPFVVGCAQPEGEPVIRGVVRYLDQRSGTAPFVKKALRYVFPDHWTFLLGEVALYCFVVLVATGVYLTFFFEPSTAQTIYHGPYGPLQGREMSEAYRSVLNISFTVKAGLLIRQTHHWAANVFLVAIALHLMRVFFTGAFRKPRDLTWLVGLTMLVLALLEGYAGYSLADDLLSGMGLAIGYSVALSVPAIGANLALLIWGGVFPGSQDFWARLYIAHVLLLPVAIGALLTLHLILVASRHHTQFRETRRTTEKTVVGVPTFPGQAPRSLGLLSATAAFLFLLGGLVQINPVWLYGPYHVSDATNGAQPDWYLGWLIGGLRLMPGFDVVIGRYTLVANPFWGGVLFPTVVFAVLALWPWLERKTTGDVAFHNLLDRPRDAPNRTALGAAMFVFVALVFVAGSSDRVYVTFGISYPLQIWIYRALVIVAPFVTYVVTKRVCSELRRGARVEDDREAAEREALADTAA